MQEIERDVNGLVFASLFDETMNDDAAAFASQSNRSSVVAFADKDRLEKFIKDNQDSYKLVKTSGETMTVDSLDDGIRLVISPIKIERIKNRELKSFISQIDAKDEDVAAVEIKATPLKEHIDIISAIFNGDHATAKEIMESFVVEKINDRIEELECEADGIAYDDYLEEKFRIKVNAKGKRRRKLICKKGFKVSPNGRSCVRISASEKLKRKIGMRKALRTKKGKGAALNKRMQIKRRRALQKRNSMGL